MNHAVAVRTLGDRPRKLSKRVLLVLAFLLWVTLSFALSALFYALCDMYGASQWYWAVVPDLVTATFFVSVALYLACLVLRLA